MGSLKTARLILITAGFILTATAPNAMASIVFGPFGSEGGETDTPRGVAVDSSNGQLFIADRGNNRVDVYDSGGVFIRAFGWGVADGANELQVCTTSCRAGIPGAGAGQLDSPSAIAVDSSAHTVYVGEEANHRVQKFGAEGQFLLMFGKNVNVGTSSSMDMCTSAGPPTNVCASGTEGFGVGQFNEKLRLAFGSGEVLAADSRVTEQNRVQRFDADGLFVGECQVDTGGRGRLQGLAVDSSGNAYVATDNSTGAVRKVDPSCNLTNTLNPSFNITSLAIGPEDRLFVADEIEVNDVAARFINEYDAVGNLIRVFGYGNLDIAPEGIAFFQSANGDIFASQGQGANSKVVYFHLPPPGPIVLPEAIRNFAKPIGNVRATLNATINPEGKATNFRFEYVDDATYEKDVEELGGGHGFDHAKRSPESEGEEGSAGSDFSPHAVSRQIGCLDAQDEGEVLAGKCLVPDTLYHFRAVARNADAPTGHTGPEATFTTKPPVEFIAGWATEVGSNAAVVHATIDPLGIPTSARFQYVEEEKFQVSGFEEASESQSIDFGAGEGGVTRSIQLTGLNPATSYRYRLLASDIFDPEIPDQPRTFITFPVPGALPACPNDPFRLGAGSSLPDCRAYEMVSPLDKENGDVVVLNATADRGFSAELPQAAVDGTRLTYASYRPFADPNSAPFTVQYLANRGSGGWVSEPISPPREGASVYPVAGQDTQYRLFSEDLCSGWLWTDSEPLLAPGAVATFGNIYRRANCGAASYEALSTVEPSATASVDYIPEIQGRTADGTHTIFRANAKLSEDASETTIAGKPIFQVYESSTAGPRLVSVLPDGGASGLNSSAGAGNQKDGSGFRHDNLIGAVSDDGSRIYWSASRASAIAPGTIYLRENPLDAGEECLEASSPCTRKVSETVGGKASSEPAQFWVAAADGSRAIFSFTAGDLNGNLYEYDAASGTSQLIAGKVDGVLGASQDATAVYLSSREALAPGAVEGTQNVYLYRPGRGLALVATLSTNLATDQSGYCVPASEDAFRRCSRVSPDGEHLALTTRTQLTGYDNTDALSGQADSEVYLYDAGKEELRCISCNPSRARPAGRPVSIYSAVTWVASQIPVPKSALHPSRALSPDGNRLFFESYDSLLPRDTNGKGDVYEWEAAPDLAACDQIGAELYVPSAAGCLSLISSGRSAQDSEFVDASTSGDDVFFKTGESLWSPDPGLIDVYDARVNGGFPVPPSPRPPCEGEACAPAPPPPPVVTPSSSVYQGPENKTTTKPKQSKCPKGKHRVKKAGKSRCVVNKKKKAQEASKKGRAGR